MDILIVSHCGKELNEKSLLNTCNKSIHYLQKHLKDSAKESLTLAFVSSQKMKELNFRFRNKDSVTDVLSFPADKDEESLGDLIFCVEKMEMQSIENQHSLHSEFLYLFIHGFLHLHGYDHQTSSEKEVMFSIQDQAFYELTKQGLSDAPFFN